jgi:hypothetical protein
MIIQIVMDFNELTWSDEVSKILHGKNNSEHRIVSGFSKRYRDRYPIWGTYRKLGRDVFPEIMTPLG